MWIIVLSIAGCKQETGTARLTPNTFHKQSEVLWSFVLLSYQKINTGSAWETFFCLSSTLFHDLTLLVPTQKHCLALTSTLYIIITVDNVCCGFVKWIYGKHAVEPDPSLWVESGHMRLLASQEEKGVAVNICLMQSSIHRHSIKCWLCLIQFAEIFLFKSIFRACTGLVSDGSKLQCFYIPLVLSKMSKPITITDADKILICGSPG